MDFNPHTDNRYLGLTFDTQTGISILTALRDIGYEKVSVQLMISFALSKIEHRQEKLEKMKHLLEVRESISVSGLATALGVTRHTIYNWRAAGYVFRTATGQIDLKETVDFWETIGSWVQ